jgi:4-aminobutyrate aminotransferase
VECAKAIESQLLKTIAPADEVAAIVVEPVQGEGGYIVPPPKFLEELERIARKFGMLLIFDEVQSGMGRTGKMWAADHFSITPDIFAVAKGIASGMPLSATVARAEIMRWPPGSQGTTFGGNPVSVAASLATIELLEQELVDNAAQIGEYMMDRMKSWTRRYPHVGDVRGLGLMLTFELVKDKATRQAFPELRDRIVERAFERGLLILGAGESAVRLSPPLIITQEQADFALETLEECLQGTSARA